MDTPFNDKPETGPSGPPAEPPPGDPVVGGYQADPHRAPGPAYQADPHGTPGHVAYPAPYVLRRPTNNMALAALIVGLVSLFSCPLIGAVAVYLGNRARAEIRMSGEEGDGLALAGLIIGWCAVGLAALMILFFAVYIGFVAVMFGGAAAGVGW